MFYGYDLRSLQTFARFDSATGEGVTNVYDGFGRLGSTTIDLGGVSRELRFQYREDGARTRIRHPDGAGFGWRYNARAQLTDLRLEPGVLDWPLVEAGYDPEGRPNILTRGAGVAISTYQYYPTDRLWLLHHNLAGGAANDLVLAFSYNRAGGVSQAIRDNVTDAYAWQGHHAANRAYVTNGLNQYSSAGSATFTYDANGNLTGEPAPGGGTIGYTYDVENRLVGRSGGPSTGSGGPVTLRYDPLGRLWRVTGRLSDTIFLYDGDALTVEYDAAGIVRHRYVHGSDAGADDPLVWYEGATLDPVRHLFADERGSIVAVADANGSAIARNSYDEYGIPAAGNIGRFQYTGQIWLHELGLYYYKARAYSPTLGRFMQTDPVGYEGGINLYAYVGDNPVNATDPSGTDICRTCSGRVYGNISDPNQRRTQRLRSVSTAAGAGRDAAAGVRTALSMQGETARALICVLAVCEDTNIRVYRAVDPGEAEDIAYNGVYRAFPGGAEGKYFFPTRPQAENFARMAEARYGFQFIITSGEFTYRQLGTLQYAAGEGHFYYVERQYLPHGPVRIYHGPGEDDYVVARPR